MKSKQYQPKTGQPCHCKPGQQRDNCPDCEGTGMRIDFKAIREKTKAEAATAPVGSKWSLDTLTGCVYENGIGATDGAMSRLVDQANSAPALLEALKGLTLRAESRQWDMYGDDKRCTPDARLYDDAIKAARTAIAMAERGAL